MNDSYEAKLNAHYGRPDLGQAILDWLAGQGKDLNALTIEDLAPADQYHHGGFASTVALAEIAQVSRENRVADLGGAIGGPARYLAINHGSSVDVVDLTEEFCRVGKMLTAQMGLAEKVSFRCASATDTGLPDGIYDLVWMQNVAMNIEDRPALYGEIRRLLKPGGRYVFEEIMAGDSGPAYYPVNWASTQNESFLQSPEAVMRMLLDAGFRAILWADQTRSETASRRAQLTSMVEVTNSTAPRPGYLSPENLLLARTNLDRANVEGRLRYARGLFAKL